MNYNDSSERINLCSYKILCEEISSTHSIIFFLCITYTLISLVNKLAIRDLNDQNLLILLQTTIVLIGECIFLFFSNEKFNISWKKIELIIPAAIFFSVAYISYYKSFQYLKASTISVISNMNLVLMSIFDYHLFGRQFHISTEFSLLILIIGAIMYYYIEVEISTIGYIWLFTYILTHEILCIYEKYLMKMKEFSSFDLTLISSLFSWPFLLISSYTKIKMVFPLLLKKSGIWV